MFDISVYQYKVNRCFNKESCSFNLNSPVTCHSIKAITIFISPFVPHAQTVIYLLCKIVLTNKQMSFKFIKNPHFK